ncbi:GspH/FimT family pseudopilin [Roseateles sp. DC23W]|uniref:Type II secretion system protein H n=1 Tax=Pelomonas dachongensis TaxID=3299029 RepID=A0ABW7ERU9_9BURK
MMRARSRGVSLVEVMVVLALLAIMLMAVAPNVSTWIRNTQIRNVATGMVNGLQRARSEAMRRNENVRFSLVSLTDPAVMDGSCQTSGGGASWVVSLDDPSDKCDVEVSDSTAPRILDKQAAGSGGARVTVKALSAANEEAPDVVFNGFGRAANAGDIATISVVSSTSDDDSRPLRIVVGTGGTVRMCDPKVTSSGDPRGC